MREPRCFVLWLSMVDNESSDAAPVAIALVVHEEKVLIAYREEGTHLAGLWEFPGGKVEEGETPEQAAVRECREECGVEVEVEELFEDLVYKYSDRTLQLFFYRCRWVAGELTEEPSRILQWCALSDLHKYPMPAANERIIKKLLGI